MMLKQLVEQCLNSSDFRASWLGELGKSIRHFTTPPYYLHTEHQDYPLLEQSIRHLIASSTPENETALHTILTLYRRKSWIKQVNGPESWIQWYREQQEQLQIELLKPTSLDIDITVLIPSYKRPDKLKHAVASVQNQTANNWQIIICDDGSQDETATIGKALAQQDQRISLIQNPQNMGLKASMDQLYQSAKTMWVTTLADDDQLMPQWLESMNNLLSQYPWSAMVGGGYYILNAIKKEINLKQIGPFYKKACIADPQTEMQRVGIINPVFGGGMTVRKEVLKNISPADLNLQGYTYSAWDWLINSHLLAHYEVAYSPQIVAIYINQEGSTEQFSFREEFGHGLGQMLLDLMHHYENFFGPDTYPGMVLDYFLEFYLRPNLLGSVNAALQNIKDAKALDKFWQNQQKAWQIHREVRFERRLRVKENADLCIEPQTVLGLTGSLVPEVQTGQIPPLLNEAIKNLQAQITT